MRVDVIDVTPAIARRWLSQNNNVRNIIPAVVENYRGIMERGEYVLTHQGIAFDSTGLIDGQHRLTAISAMPDGFRVKMLVAKNLPDKAKLAMDIGKKRDAHTILGEPQGLTAICNFFFRIAVARPATSTPTLLIPYHRLFRRSYASLMEYSSSVVKVWASASMRAAFCWIDVTKGDSAYAGSVYAALVRQDFKELPPIAAQLVRACHAGTVSSRDKLDLFVRALKVLNPENAEKKLAVHDVAPTIAVVRDELNKRLARFSTSP